jgi:hypothetical protein
VAETYDIVGGTNKFFSPPIQARFFRLTYTNGSTAQAEFHTHTTLKTQAVKWSSHNVNDNLSDEDDGELTVSVLKLRTAADTYVSAASTAGGNFKMSVEEFETGVSSNSNSQLNTTLFKSDGTELNLDASGDLQVDVKTLPGVLVTGNTTDFATETTAAAILADTASMDTSLSTVSGAVHTIDSAVGSTDPGVAILGQHKEDQVHLSTADGDYDVLTIDSLGSLHVNTESHHIFDELDATAGWSALGNDTLNLATTTVHVMGLLALTFDKVNGAANTVFAGIQKTLSSTDLGSVSPHDIIQTCCYVSSIADIDYVFLRLGTDSSNYNEWRIDAANLEAGTIEVLAFVLGDASHAGSTGNGWDASAITYVAVGCAFNAESDTLSGIIFDQVSYHTNQHTTTSISSEVSSSVSSPNVRLNGYGGSTSTGSGVVDTNTLRVVLPTDQPSVTVDGTITETNSAAILADTASMDTNLGTLAGAVTGTEMQVDIVTMPAVGGGVQYAEGATAATATGTVMLGEAGANVVRPLQLDASNYLQVAIAADTYGVGGGVNYATNDTTALPTGTMVFGTNASDQAKPFLVDASRHLQVDIAADSVGIGGGIQYAQGATVAAATGTVFLWEGAANEIKTVSAADPLPVTGTFNVDGSTIAVTGGSLPVTNAGTFATQATLQAGTAAFGKLSANDGVDIGDVTVNNAAGASAVNIQDGGNSITVDGTITEANSAAILADTASMDTNLGTVAGAVAAGQMQVDIVADGAGLATSANQLPDGHNVTVDNASIAVTATNLDTRDLAATQDFVTVSGATLAAIQAAVEGTLTVTPSASFLTYSANHDSFPVNANVQMQDADVTSGNPLAVYDAGATLATEATLSTLSNTTSTISGHLATMDTNLATVAGAVTGSEMQVDIITMPAVGGGVQYAEGATAATATGTMMMWEAAGNAVENVSAANPLPVTGTFSVDGSTVAVTGGSLPVTNAGTFATQATLQAGTAAFGKLSANDGVDIGDVTINNASIAVTATNLDVRNLASTTDFVTASGAVLSAIQTAVEGTLTVDGSAVTQPVSGSVTANLGTIAGVATETTAAAILADTATIDTNVATVAGAVAAGQMQVDIVADGAGLATSANQLPDGHAVTVDNAAGASAVNIQDGGNSITVDGTVTANLGTTDNAVLDNIQAAVDYKGTTIAAASEITASAEVGADASMVAAPGAGNHLEIHHIKGSNHGGEIRFQLKNGSAGAVVGEYTLAASGGGFSEQLNPPIVLSSNTDFYYNWISNAYNPDVTITTHHKSVAD